MGVIKASVFSGIYQSYIYIRTFSTLIMNKIKQFFVSMVTYLVKN